MNSNMLSSDWLKRRWLDFRNGHSVYLVFTIAFIQFVVLTYTLAIERISFLKEIFPSMWMWGLLFIAIYMPAAVIIGHLHRKFQIPTETRQLMDANPFIYYVQPGREKLVHMPAYILDLKVRIQWMMMQNAMADAIEKISKETKVNTSSIPRFDQSVFKEYDKILHIYEKLTKGENVLDILGDLQRAEQQQNKEINVGHKDT
jgi:hypothetical protein